MIDRRSIREFPQRRALVHSNVIGLVTSDFILRFILAGVNRVSPELRASRDHTNDSTANAARFRIPAHVIALAERSFGHLDPPSLTRRLEVGECV